MDFLNKSFAQLKDLFLSMTPGARITTALLLAVVVTSVGYLFTHEIHGPDDYLFGGEPIPPSQLPAMEAALGEAGLEHEMQGTRIRVPKGKKSVYMAALAQNNVLPHNFGDILQREINNGTAYEGKDRREERMKIAKQRELSLIISSMKGIERASVLYDVQEVHRFGKDDLATASVQVKPVGSQPLAPQLASSIRDLVVGAIAGLKPQDVVVTDLNTGRTSKGGEEGLGSPEDDAYIARKQFYEQDWSKKIIEALAYVRGATVTVNVELDQKQSMHTEEVKHDPKPVTYTTTSKTTSRTNESAAPQGRPGYVAQGNTARTLNVATTSAGSTEQEDEEERTEASALNSQVITTDNVGLTPTRVAVSVGIPTSYYEQIWRERNPPESGAEPPVPDQNALDQIRQQEETKIQQHVANLLDTADGVDDMTQMVTVTEFQSITPEAIPAPPMSEKAMTWFAQSWSTLGMIVLVLLSLLILRSMVQSSPAAETQRPKPSPEAESDEEAEPREGGRARRLMRFTGSGESLRDELSGLVSEDPETAATILRNWIGSGV